MTLRNVGFDPLRSVGFRRYDQRVTNMNHVEAQRISAIQNALSLPLPDAVYAIVSYNDWCGPFGHKIELNELHSKGSATELEEWAKKSHQLRHDAYAVGDAGYRNDGSYVAIRARFESANPGFGRASYESAVRYGYQQAR